MIDLSLDENAQEVVAAAADLIDKAAPLDRLRPAGGDEALFAVLAEWGWFGMGVPADEGGFGLGLGEQALVWTAAGQRLVAPSVLATALVARFGPEAARAGMRSGASRAAFAVFDGRGGWYAIEPERAELLVAVDGERLQFHAAADFTGAAVEPFDEALSVRHGRFASAPLSSAQDGGVALLLISALMAGAAAGAAALAIDCAGTREQFGRPIGAFQAVKHRCADMGIAGFAAEAQVALAAASLDEGAPGASLHLAAAAIQARKAARANGQGVIQVHGGMGFTEECHAHRFFKRAHLLGMILGNADPLIERLLTVG